ERAVKQLDRARTDSNLTMDNAGIPVAPSETGRTLDAATAVAAALETERRRDVAAALAAKTAAERMTSDVVVTYGKSKWTIRASVVRSWLHLEQRADGSAWPVVDA